eukprot:scaffold103_cov193-Alexandrium_tamarense.AAC.38
MLTSIALLDTYRCKGRDLGWSETGEHGWCQSGAQSWFIESVCRLWCYWLGCGFGGGLRVWCYWLGCGLRIWCYWLGCGFGGGLRRRRRWWITVRRPMN